MRLGDGARRSRARARCPRRACGRQRSNGSAEPGDDAGRHRRRRWPSAPRPRRRRARDRQPSRGRGRGAPRSRRGCRSGARAAPGRRGRRPGGAQLRADAGRPPGAPRRRGRPARRAATRACCGEHQQSVEQRLDPLGGRRPPPRSASRRSSTLAAGSSSATSASVRITRQRGAQLVAGVGDEAPLGVDASSDAVEHRVERVGELDQLVARRAASSRRARRAAARRSARAVARDRPHGRQRVARRPPSRCRAPAAPSRRPPARTAPATGRAPRRVRARQRALEVALEQPPADGEQPPSQPTSSADVDERQPQRGSCPQRHTPVAGARHRVHDRRLAELAPQLHHRHPHDVGERVDVGVPDRARAAPRC